MSTREDSSLGPASHTLEGRRAQAFPTLTAEQVARLERCGAAIGEGAAVVAQSHAHFAATPVA